MRSTAREVCVSLEARDLKSHYMQQHCYDNAVSGAIKTIHQPALTARYQHDSARAAATVDNG